VVVVRIVVIGAGKLGYSVAQLLAQEQYEVVVIEKDEARREIVKNSLDVLTIAANGASPIIMKDYRVKGADVVVATTDSDEVNMVACLLAKANGVKYTVARIRDTDYAKSTVFMHKNMGVDLFINPEQVTAVEINRILMTPSAMEVEDFAEGKVSLFETRMHAGSAFLGKTLLDLVIQPQILVAAIFRNHEMIIPHGDDIIQENDDVYFVRQREALQKFTKQFASTKNKISRVMIIGAGRTGRFLAPLLERQGLFVKIIDKNEERCRLVAEKLEKGIALCGDGTDIDLLTEEGISEADVVICITEDDKLNLMLALMAKHMGAGKTIVRVARNEYGNLMEKVGVDVVLSSRLLASGEILRFIHSGGVVSVSLLADAKVQAMEIIVAKDSYIAGKSLKDATLPKECLLCAVVHEGEASVPSGATIIYPGDRVVIFLQTEATQKVLPLFEGR